MVAGQCGPMSGRFERDEVGTIWPSAALSPVPCLVEFRMRRSIWTPSIVPNGDDQNVYLVVDDLGRLGRVWREADADTTDLETVFQDLLGGQYSSPVRVISFNTVEGWSRDVSGDIADELRRRFDLRDCDLPASIYNFVEQHEKRRPAAADTAADLTSAARTNVGFA